MNRRNRMKAEIPTVALVGYTNAGKSTLMNAITGEDTFTADQLFATLDTLTRKIETKSHASIMVVDTVGFIRKLPHHLIESFKATLGDIANADLCLHVVDASHSGFVEQMDVADRTLRQIVAADVPEIHVFNKIDAVDSDELLGLRRRYPDAVFISAAKRSGIDELLGHIELKLLGKSLAVEVKIPAADGRAIARIKSLLRDTTGSVEDGFCVFKGTIESKLVDRLEQVAGAEVRYLFS